MPEKYLELGYYNILPNPYLLTIYDHFPMQLNVIYIYIYKPPPSQPPPGIEPHGDGDIYI